MDKLQFQIIDREQIPGNIEQYNVEVLLNGVSLSRSLFSFEVLATASPKCLHTKFGLYTCSCGVPECAGYMDEITLDKTDNTVSWVFPEEAGYSPEKQVYVFDRVEYEKEIEALYALMLDLETKKVFHESTIEAVEDEDGASLYTGYNANVQSAWTSFSNLAKWVSALEETYRRVSFCKTTLDEMYPEFKDRVIRVGYADLKSEWTHSFDEFVYLVANTYPNTHRVEEDFGDSFELIMGAASIVAASLEKSPLKVLDCFLTNRPWITEPDDEDDSDQDDDCEVHLCNPGEVPLKKILENLDYTLYRRICDDNKEESVMDLNLIKFVVEPKP